MLSTRLTTEVVCPLSTTNGSNTRFAFCSGMREVNIYSNESLHHRSYTTYYALLPPLVYLYTFSSYIVAAVAPGIFASCWHASRVATGSKPHPLSPLCLAEHSNPDEACRVNNPWHIARLLWLVAGIAFNGKGLWDISKSSSCSIFSTFTVPNVLLFLIESVNYLSLTTSAPIAQKSIVPFGSMQS